MGVKRTRVTRPGLPHGSAKSAFCVVIGSARAPSETRDRVKSPRITTRLGEKRILCGNRLGTSTIGDAHPRQPRPGLPHGSAKSSFCVAISSARALSETRTRVTPALDYHTDRRKAHSVWQSARHGRHRRRVPSSPPPRITTRIGERRILCGNRQSTSAIGDA